MTHGQLLLSLLTRRGLTHTHTHQKNPNEKEKGLPWGSVGWLVSWRHVSPSHTRTRRRKRRLRRQRSDDDERTGLHTTTNELGSTRRRTPSTKTSRSLNCSSTRRYNTPDSASSDRLSLGWHAPWACLFPLGQSGQRTRPPLARVTGGAWHGAREIIPRKQAPTLSHP